MKQYLVKMAFLQDNILFKNTNIKKRKVNYLSVLFLLGLIISFGCKKKEDSIGLKVQPQGDQLNVVEIDTTTIITYSVKEDSLRTDELNGANMLGTYIDPYFGKMDASIVSQIRLESSVNFALTHALDSLVIDSVVMYLALDGAFGNLDPQNFEVYQINEDIHIDSNYYTSSSVSTIGPNLAIGGAITPNPISVGYVGGIITNYAILNIPLSNTDFGLKMFNESGNISLGGNDGTGEFVDWYKGLLIKANNPTQNPNEGGILYVDMVNEYSKVTIYYRDTSGITSAHDTLSFDFNFNSSCAHFHQVTIDYTGTVVEAQLNDSTLGTDVFFLQAQGGTKAKVHFPYINELIASGNIVVNKAELILPFQYNTSDNYTPAEQLFLTRTNDEGNETFLPDFTESDAGGQMDLATKTYTFNVTRYINKLFSGEFQNDGLTLIVSGSGVTANRVILNGINSSNKDKAKLILTYSKY